MKKEIIVSAKTIEDALAEAARELGADSVEKLEYTVIDEPKKGLFGIGAVPAKISASYVCGGEEDAVAMVKELLANMNIEANIAVCDGENSEKKIVIEGENAAILIGHHGETLDALQYLSNLACAKKNSKGDRITSHVIIDIEGYREKREQTLRALARRKATEALRKKRSIILEPMSAYERRIIHSEIQTIDGVATHSIGADHNRKVVIYLDDSAAEDGVGGADDNAI